MDRVINIAIFSILFFSGIVLFAEPFEFYITYIPVLILLPVFMIKYKFPVKMLYLFIPLLVFGTFSVFVGDNTTKDFLKIFLNIFVSSTFFYYVFQYYNRDVNRVFELYIKGAVFVSIIGIIQFISFKVGFKYGYNFTVYGFNKWSYSLGGFGIRINSILTEPSYYGATLGPAFFIAIYNVLFRKSVFMTRRQCFIIIIPYIMTFSTVAYIGIFVTLILLLINFGLVRYIFLVIPISMFVFYIMYNNAPEFRVRVDGLKALYVDNILEKEGLKDGEVNFVKLAALLKKVHGSSFVQYNNYIVSAKNIREHPFFGTGLGSHSTAFERYNVLDKLGNIYKFNTSDGNSMLLRMMSEMGLFGVIFILMFISKFYLRIPGDSDTNHYWLISNAALLIIILQLARQGNYTYNGFIFYMWLYYYACETEREREEPNTEEDKEGQGNRQLIPGN